jgi:hypothetical protein
MNVRCCTCLANTNFSENFAYLVKCEIIVAIKELPSFLCDLCNAYTYIGMIIALWLWIKEYNALIASGCKCFSL